MLKSIIFLAAVAQAQEAEAEAAPAEQVTASWVLAETTKATWEDCQKDSDCAETHVCAKHMWKNVEDNEYDSGYGCAWKGACAGTATWEYYGGVQWVQYFCTPEQAEGADALEQPWKNTWTPAAEKKETVWKNVCEKNDDCENDMLCREYYYDLDDELKSWDRGKICVGDWI